MTNEMIKHCVIKIYGDVHGVGFRWSAKQKAEELGIVGFVRNEPDGTVYIEVQGEDNDLEQFMAWCQQGPPPGQVKQVKCDYQDSQKIFTHFTIARWKVFVLVAEEYKNLRCRLWLWQDTGIFK